MRVLVSFIAVGLLALMGCAGDSSVLMSVWNDGGVPPSNGGGGGQTVVSSGGIGGGSPVGGSGGAFIDVTISVPGGARDLATAQCTSASGGNCVVSSEYLSCLKGSCRTELTACYTSDGIATAVGGDCQDYANCMLSSPCNASRSKFETDCWNNYVISIPECFTCLAKLDACQSKFSCVMTMICP